MKRLFLSLFSTLMLICAILVGGYWHDAYVVQPSSNAGIVQFVVQHGESVKAIAAKLKDSGIIQSAQKFEIFARLNDAAQDLQAGTFSLKPGMNFQELIATLSNAVASETQVTIPEGYTAAQIGETVHAAIPTITKADWHAAITGPRAFGTDIPASVRGKVNDIGLEGFLFPDTYRLDPKAEAKTVVGTLWTNFWIKVPAAGMREDERGHVAHGLNFYEFITLASIVEREVQSPEDMKLVAGIFLKRLEKGMPLQADSTVNYVTGKKAPRISIKDTEIESPYNTYASKGLPPGPISNPGLNAMHAVVEPTQSPWFYFLTTPEGSVHYARTYDEHVANKQKYLR